MKIERIVYEYSVTKTYTVKMSASEGYDMPETVKSLVETINSIKDSPKDCHDMRISDNYDEEVEFKDYWVIEGE